MKLLALPEKDGESQIIMIRDTNYLIRNIAVPVPNAMQKRDFDRREVMIISHFGWRRCSMAYDSYLNIETFFDRVFKYFKESGFLRSLTDKKMSLVKDQITKFAFIELGAWKYLYEELKVENALDFSFGEKLPVVITVPCESEGNYRYFALENFTNNFVSYINYRVINGQSVYVLPTYPSSGKVIGDDGESWKDSLNFSNSYSGRLVFGNLLEYPWSKIYFAGGQINACLKTTLGYFLKKENINIIDNFCFGSDDVEYSEIPEDLEHLCRKKSVLLANPRSERRIRNVLLKVLDPYYPIDHRWIEYSSIFNVFNKYGLREDNSQNNSNSQVRVGVF